MPLESIDHILCACQEGGYAVGDFESWNIESLQGVLDAAEQTRLPILIGFNGEFLCSPSRRTHERLALYAALGKAAAEAVGVPCGLVFNECPDDTRVMEAVDAGFNLVMPVGGGSADDDPPHAADRRLRPPAPRGRRGGIGPVGLRRLRPARWQRTLHRSPIGRALRPPDGRRSPGRERGKRPYPGRWPARIPISTVWLPSVGRSPSP